MFERFLNNLLIHGLEYFKKYYGVYRGTVTATNDPQNRGRIQAHVPTVGQQFALNVWIDPAFRGAGNDRGMFWPPEVGDSVRVAFTQGDPSCPCMYWGGWYGTGDMPSELAPEGSPTKRGFITRGGHSLLFDDTEGEESLEITWHKPSTQPLTASETPPRTGDKATLKFVDGGITLVFKDDQKIEITDVEITLGASQVKIAIGADQKAVRGDDLIQYLNGHTHGTAWGPSSPPISPVPPTVLSRNVKL